MRKLEIEIDDSQVDVLPGDIISGNIRGKILSVTISNSTREEIDRITHKYMNRLREASRNDIPKSIPPGKYIIDKSKYDLVFKKETETESSIEIEVIEKYSKCEYPGDCEGRSIDNPLKRTKFGGFPAK